MTVLGQWLTYIGLELERINSEQAEPSVELKQLHEDTQGAIAELRDTLMELRASVGPGRPLSVLLGEVVDRVRKRSTSGNHLGHTPRSDRPTWVGCWKTNSSESLRKH